MSTLSLALCCEGSTDQHFLPIVIQRTAENVLDKCAKHIVEVLPVEVIEAPKRKQGRGILEAAIKAAGRHSLIVHTDADNRTYEQAKNQSFVPGYNLVQRTTRQVCKNLVPIIPIREIEAWMLADHEVLREVLGTNVSAQNLGLPEKARLVEANPDPKAAINKVIAIAYAKRSKRHRKVYWNELYESLAQEIRLERLKEVPAYKHFEEDLTEVLITLNVIPRRYEF